MACLVDNNSGQVNTKGLIHVHHVLAKENQLDSRCSYILVRPGRIRGNINTSEFLIADTKHLVILILDALNTVIAKQ